MWRVFCFSLFLLFIARFSHSNDLDFKSEYERLTEIIQKQKFSNFNYSLNVIQNLIPKDTFIIKLILDNSINNLGDYEFYSLIEKNYKDYLTIKDLRNFFLNKIIDSKKELDDNDLFYIDFLINLRDFQVNLKIFEIIKNKNVPEKTLDKLIYFILQSDNFSKADYFNFIIKNKNYLKNKDILYVIMKILYEKNLNNEQTLKLVTKIKNIIKNQDIVSWIKENESFFKDTKGGKFVNDKIIKRYLGTSEYTDLVILENSSTSKDIKYEVLKKRRDIILFPDKWYRVFRVLTREMIFRNEDDKYLHDDLFLYQNKNNLHEQFVKINEEILEIISSFDNLSFDFYINKLWLCGYINFKLKNYEKAIEFFEKLRDNAKSKREISKAYFWLAECYDKLESESKKNLNLHLATNYFLFFYGQFAIEKLNIDLKTFIKEKFQENKEISKSNQEEIFSNTLFSLFILSKDVDESLSKEILRSIMRSDNVHDNIKMKILYFIKHNAIEYYSTLVKTNEPFVNLEEFYELKNITKNPFLHALIKKESNFMKRSKSYKGARGMMQIMPQTAMGIAKNLNIKYDIYRLLVDDYYNLVLGVKYLDMLFKKYNNHKILTLAAYNAGPNRVDRWVDKKGDPREATEILDIILWTERIPIEQTRDYVKKIIESEIIYEILYEQS